MSPVARRQSRGHTGKAVLVALVGVAVALGVAYAVVAFSTSSDSVEIRLGDDRFEAGDAEDIADDIADEGAPVGYPDVASGRRPIWLDHLGDDPEVGWVAFGAYLPDDPDCTVNWQADEDAYVADCDESIRFDRSGEGLREFPVTVEDGDLFVDLREDPGTTGG